MSSEFAWLRSSYGYVGDAKSLFLLAKDVEGKGQLGLAATAYDRAYGLDPENKELVQARQKLLDSLAVTEYGIKFRYIPAGAFLMGSTNGDPDEQPAHPVELSEFWLSETPVSWAAYCDLMGWEPPPIALPKDFYSENRLQFQGGEGPEFSLHEENKIRFQYCEDATQQARDWHAHVPEHNWIKGTGELISSRELFGKPYREDPRRPWRYDRKPMVGVSWKEVEILCGRISSSNVVYRLPTEAEWEKAARGGLINCIYAWGNEPPTEERCDFNRFDHFSILPMRRFPPYGYGLYAMNGCVWEWVTDWYDALYYRESPLLNPKGPENGVEKVLRGGSWSDCAEVVTVSFRMSRLAGNWREVNWGGHFAPNIGFRLCRIAR